MTSARAVDGLLVIDKPEGPTSHDVVARVRRILGQPRAGHTGTLDPLASGVLPVLLGRGTRFAQFLSGDRKTYRAVIRFGHATTTYDREGEPVGPPGDSAEATPARIEAALDRFRGTFLQAPPAFSAKKVGGTSAHRLARRGAAVAPAAAPVTVYRLVLVASGEGTATVELDCAAGFYVRSLAHDLGAALGCGAHLARLQRTASGPFVLADAVPLPPPGAGPGSLLPHVRPLGTLLPGWPAVLAGVSGVQRARQGLPLRRADCLEWPVRPAAVPEGVSVRVLDEAGDVVALAAWDPRPEPELLHPRIVLV